MLKSLIKLLGLFSVSYLYGILLRYINLLKCEKIRLFKLDPNTLKSTIRIFAFGFLLYLYGVFLSL